MEQPTRKKLKKLTHELKNIKGVIVNSDKIRKLYNIDTNLYHKLIYKET